MKIMQVSAFFLLFLSFASQVATAWGQQADMLPADSSHERNINDLEDLLLSVPDPSILRSNLKFLTQRSHVASTKGDYENARFVRDKLREYGFDANIEKVRVMMSFPQQRPSLSTSFGFHAKLSEDILAEDATSGTTSWRNHTFLAYSPSGKVTANVVYANYGRPQDFDALEEMGISVEGRIVLMRYGACFRGLKIMNAEQRGAIGSLIYSDPADDGFSKGATYPKGPWRPPSSVQRGSVQFISKCAGDPWRLYARNTSAILMDDNNRTMHSAKDICGFETRDLIPSHPALPLSYEDALPLLAHLEGQPAPASFQGGLNISYTVGPSTYDVTFQTNHSLKPRNIPNVVAKLKASDDSKNARKSIILGNHRDAWVFGAVDPNSGTTTLLEVARTLQTVIQNGWTPKRDIILASWSGEEFGLLGSTAFAELNARSSLSQEAVAYLNVDCAVAGNATLNVSATHSLNVLFKQAIQKVPAPPPPFHSLASTSSPLKTLTDTWNGRIGTLGSGSDYTAFLDRFGIASMDMTYRGSYGVYHSVYDSFSWMERECDPTFEIHQAMARLWALMAFRLASTEILPIIVTPQADQMELDLELLKEKASVKFGNKVEFFRLDEAVVDFHTAAVAIDEERTRYETPSLRATHAHDKAVQDINRRLSLVERQFLGPGLPNRPYFRHVLQAPGYYLGYGSQAFPGIAQAIDDGDSDVTQSEIVIAATAVTNAALFLRNKISGEAAG